MCIRRLHGIRHVRWLFMTSNGYCAMMVKNGARNHQDQPFERTPKSCKTTETMKDAEKATSNHARNQLSGEQLPDGWNTAPPSDKRFKLTMTARRRERYRRHIDQ
ncbi:hypothetical protein FVEG_17045 [Fusarium verticillioides 7600]|uniref:Uncharacterized protein n=1 Tax=Gibberella moniliformis (strain M3125 / FGSC 7600) TaxID=334819 RepID=W7MYW9_GIBM7|nr:hypothetical protein FVEG_17045 [Fusarium verticillioides 7600]EWG52994.1 hypothetical protein FVEG_17045 [Fusarium verticillioides 7600]